MIDDLTIFTSSICNLKCQYCYVKKEPSVFEYDKELIRAIEQNEYIKRFKKEFPESVNTIKTLEFWGAEPSIHLNLIAEKLKDYKEAFPNLCEITMSSNYTLPTFIDNVSKLLNAMGELKDTQWHYHLQCSIDGSKEITDNNRGNGTTDLIIENVNKLKLLDIPKNVYLTVNNKATISKEQFNDLSDYNSCEEYYNFLKNILEFKGVNKNFNFSAPTCVEPIYYTKEDGIKYAKIIENFVEICKKNNCFFMPYVRNRETILCDTMKGGFCGQCRSVMIMLPNNEYAVCHRSGLDTVDAHYKARQAELQNEFDRELISKDNWVCNLDKYKQLQYNMETFYDTKSKTLFQQYYNMAKLLLDIGEISSEYLNDDVLRRDIKLFMQFTICMQTNKELTGSYFCCSTYFMPLFFNGAMPKFYNFLKNKNLIVGEC